MKTMSDKMSLDEAKKRLEFKKHKAGKGGYSEWVYPKPDETYLMKCCGCGLIHEIEFGAFVERDKKRGIFTAVPLPKEIRTMFRARRFSDLIPKFTKK